MMQRLILKRLLMTLASKIPLHGAFARSLGCVCRRLEVPALLCRLGAVHLVKRSRNFPETRRRDASRRNPAIYSEQSGRRQADLILAKFNDRQ